MENVYYVMHPTLEVTAEVHAPTTEKARTTFLDWLERNNRIRREDRHIYRRNMVAERIEDPNIPCDVVLNYGYKDFSGRFEFERPEVHDISFKLEAPEVHDIPIEFEEPEVHDIPVELREPEEQRGALRQAKQHEDLKAMREAGRKRMPIQDIMLRGYVE